MQTETPITGGPGLVNEKLNQLMDADAKVEAAELELKQAKDAFYIVESEMKKLMEDMDLKTIKDGAGRAVTLTEPMLVAKINKERQEEALKWLKDNGEGYAVKESIHHGTLGKVIRTRVEEGLAFPEDLFPYTYIRQLKKSK